MLEIHFFKDFTFLNGNNPGINIYRTLVKALVADGAVIGNLFKIFEYLEFCGLDPLGNVKQRLDQSAQGQVFIPGMEKHVPCRIKYRALGFAFAAANAMGNVCGKIGQRSVLEDLGLKFHKIK
jgi:hypothetical protein